MKIQFFCEKSFYENSIFPPNSFIKHIYTHFNKGGIFVNKRMADTEIKIKKFIWKILALLDAFKKQIDRIITKQEESSALGGVFEKISDEYEKLRELFAVSAESRHFMEAVENANLASKVFLRYRSITASGGEYAGYSVKIDSDMNLYLSSGRETVFVYNFGKEDKAHIGKTARELIDEYIKDEERRQMAASVVIVEKEYADEIEEYELHLAALFSDN